MTDSSDTNNYDDVDRRCCSSMPRWKLILSTFFGILLVGVIVVISIFFVRRRSIEVKKVDGNEETIPSAIKVAPLDFLETDDLDESVINNLNNSQQPPVVLIEYTTKLSDPTIKYYYISILELDTIISTLSGSSNDNENFISNNLLHLIITQNKMPTTFDTNSFGINPIVISMILTKNKFPYQLPTEDFYPGDYNGVLIVHGGTITDDGILELNIENTKEILNGEFTIIINPNENIKSNDDDNNMPSSSTIITTTTNSPTISLIPTEQPSTIPTQVPTITNQPTGTDLPTKLPSNFPTHEPTISIIPTIQPTSNPTKLPTITPIALPPILVSTLESPDYKIEGTITIDYRTTFQQGNIIIQPILKFNIIEAPNAPGPFLYLSKRSYNDDTFETRDVDKDTTYIPIDDTNDGSFTLEGIFEQPLDEIPNFINIVDEYTNGSWIVWCEPFNVWLGGGPISSSTN